MRLRAFLYRNKFIKRHSFDVPIISVGNLTMGGTGKTPMVYHLAQLFSGHGYRPAIVSRGYGGKSTEPVNIVSDGKTLLLTAKIAGDEPRFLAENLPGIPVLIGKKRSKVCKKAIEEFLPGVIILDDGFQHLATDRQMDLVLFNQQVLIGDGWVFPGGMLRESISALQRAHAFVITGGDAGEDPKVEAFIAFLKDRYPDRPVFFAPYKVKSICQELNGEECLVDEDLSEPLFGFCGLANPQSFHATLIQNNINVVGFKEFKDHHYYTDREIQLLFDESKGKGAVGLITTEKDRVKLGNNLPTNMRLFVVKVGLAVQDDFDKFVIDTFNA